VAQLLGRGAAVEAAVFRSLIEKLLEVVEILIVFLGKPRTSRPLRFAGARP
jgi:hypothetical protein